MVKEGKTIKYMPNFLSFNIKNFHVEETGTLDDILQSRDLRAELGDSDNGAVL